jgi:hypothetical protein
MPATDVAQHLARVHVQGRKQRRRAVSLVVVRPAFGLAGAHREQGRRPVQGLDLRLLVDTEDRGVLRRVEIQPDDVADLVDQQRIGRQLECLGAMRLQAEGLPNAVHTHRADAGGLGQRAGAPVGRAARRAFQRPSHDGFDLRIVDRPRRTRPRFVQQPSDAVVDNRCRQRPTVGFDIRSFFATLVLSRPVAQARTTRARRASCGAVRARCAIETSACRSISVTTNVALGRAIICLLSRCTTGGT